MVPGTGRGWLWEEEFECGVDGGWAVTVMAVGVGDGDCAVDWQ